MQYKDKYINRHPAKQNWHNKKNCCSYHSIRSSKRSLSCFWFQSLTIESSLPSLEQIFIRQLAVFRNAKIKITIVTLITSYTNLATLKLVQHSSIQFLIDLHVQSWYSDLLLRLWGPWVFEVLECLDNFLCFSLSSLTSPFRKHSVLFFSVGLPRTVCAFVSLTRDNMIEQYINTFLETPRPNVIQTASHCCFENFGSNDIQIVPHWIIHST